MAEYSVRQRERLTAGADSSDALEENREATAALVLLVARREELERYRTTRTPALMRPPHPPSCAPHTHPHAPLTPTAQVP